MSYCLGRVNGIPTLHCCVSLFLVYVCWNSSMLVISVAMCPMIVCCIMCS
jgi:hypothetical protein